MSPKKKISICHLSVVHGVYDTRIFFKECVSLSTVYDTHFIVKHAKDEKLYGVKIHALPFVKSRIKRFLINAPILFKKALALKADIYHFHNPELIPYMLLINKLGHKIIYDVHENVQADLLEKTWLPFRKQTRKLYLYFEKQAIRKFHLVLAEESYIKLYKNRTNNYTLVQNFVQPQLFMQNPQTPDIYKDTLLVVGNLGGKRGLPKILDALLLLKNTGLRVNLHCVGQVDEAVNEILRTSESYMQIKEQVTFAGFRKLPDAYKNIENCFAGLALPEDIENHRESFPTKMFEYMAAGLPVICSDFPINRDVV
ncbi:MAG: glycosyltransferase, partial [Sphingobacteriales bacterium]